MYRIFPETQTSLGMLSGITVERIWIFGSKSLFSVLLVGPYLSSTSCSGYLRTLTWLPCITTVFTKVDLQLATCLIVSTHLQKCLETVAFVSAHGFSGHSCVREGLVARVEWLGFAGGSPECSSFMSRWIRRQKSSRLVSLSLHCQFQKVPKSPPPNSATRWRTSVQTREPLEDFAT